MSNKKILLLFFSLIFYSQLFAQTFVNRATDFGIVEGYGSLDFEEFGGGVSFFDFNGDGWDDLCFPTATGDSLLFFHNNQGAFERIDGLVLDTSATKQLLWADIDNDGDKDLLVTNFMAANRLYENDGNMNLTDITLSSGFFLFPDPTYGATFGDYDADGFLDLYITNRSNGTFDNFTNYLWKNNGNNTFTNVAIQTNTSDGLKVSFCATFIDINQNLRPDLYIANDRIATNTMFLNNGNTFSDISASSGTDTVVNAMNVGSGDYNNDGHLDIYVTNTVEGNVLYQNNGDETFTDMATSAGVAFNQVSWGGNFFDYDNDGDLDLYVSSEEVEDGKTNALYENLGDGTFHQSLPNGIDGDTLISFGNAVGDFNLDGKMDIVVVNALGDPMLIWENQTVNDNNWLKIRLEGVESNRDGISSWIEIYHDGQKQVRYTKCGTAYLAQNTQTEHFGIGSFETLDSVIVRWQSGIIDRLENVQANQILGILEGMTIVSTTDILKEKKYFEVSPNPVSENYFYLKSSFGENVEVEMQLLNASGQVVFDKKMKLMQGENQVELPMNLGSGVYFLNIRTSEFTEYQNLIKLN
ncbi:MAG: FG-GAP-like repeat-containing protein [Saprospiraceae bacterium]